MKFSIRILASRTLTASFLAIPAVFLAGCAMGSLNLSGPDPTPQVTHLQFSGRAMGGQQPVSGSALSLYTVGATGYGSAGTDLLAGSYYPDNTRGCSTTPITLSSYKVDPGGSVTLYTNSYPTTLKTGQSVTVADTSELNGDTITITSIFTNGITATVPNAATKAFAFDTGSVTPICATDPVTDANGNFNIGGDYTLPGTSTQLYLVATGGNAGAGTNSAIKLVAPVGPSSSLTTSSSFVVNEVTTVGMAFAFGQFFTPTFGSASLDTFGSGSSTQSKLGLTNAFSTYSNLVNPPSGLALGAITVSDSANTVGTVTITPETAKIYTIADILAACVNTSGPTSASCTTLFGDVVPTGGTTPTDTLQAAVDMSLNPTSTNSNGSSANLTALFGLISATPPYSGYSAPFTAGTQPADWTIGITYGSNSVDAGSSIYFMNESSYVAVDTTGNVWFTNYASSTVATNNSLAAITPAGVPYKQVLVGSFTGPSDIVIDPSNDVYVPSYGAATALGTTVAEYKANGTTASYTTDSGPQHIVSDGSGNIFVDLPAYKGPGELQKISSTGVVSTIGTGLVTDFSNVAVDASGNVYVTAGGSSGTTASGLTVSGTYPDYYICATSCSAVTANSLVTAPENAVVVGPSNVLYIQNYNTTSLISTPASSTTGTSITLPATLKAQFLAVDGAGTIWMTNYVSSAGAVFAITPSGTPLSPAAGFAHTYSGAYDIAIDPSGNVWVGNYSKSSSSTAQAFLTEIVGAAAPTISPVAAQFSGSTNKVGTKP